VNRNEEGTMKRRTKFLAAGAAAVAVALGATATIATASGGGESDTPITGPELTRASAAALDHTGGGRVTGTEVGDEESYYEVEVTLGDGRQVDVQLDRAFHVVSDKVDHESNDTGD
jgi:uncharacterized membrane protein YkoI